MSSAHQIWHGGKIMTMDPAMPWVEAMAIVDGRIVATGSSVDVLNLSGPETARHDLGGRFVMPGLVESHTHALWGACRELFDVYVGFAARLDGLIKAVRDRASRTPPGEVVHGGPWRHDMREMMGANPRALLDRVSSDHPIILADTSQHILWCNSMALDQAGIGAETPTPSGGVIERDPATGMPNGILAESAAAPARKALR